MPSASWRRAFFRFAYRSAGHLAPAKIRKITSCPSPRNPSASLHGPTSPPPSLPPSGPSRHPPRRPSRLCAPGYRPRVAQLVARQSQASRQQPPHPHPRPDHRAQRPPRLPPRHPIPFCLRLFPFCPLHLPPAPPHRRPRHPLLWSHFSGPPPHPPRRPHPSAPPPKNHRPRPLMATPWQPTHHHTPAPHQNPMEINELNNPTNPRPPPS